MGTYGTFTGLVRFFDPVTRKGYLLSLQDGDVQASMIGEGITAADENILLDASGITLHDMANASIITPTFGVGLIHNVLQLSETFGSWTMIATATVTSNAVVSPDGVTVSGDTLHFPAVGDGITRECGVFLDATQLANGQSGAFMIWLRANAEGVVRIWVKDASGGTVVGSLDCSVKTTWKRFSLLFTNNTGASIDVWAGIERNSTGQLSTVHAWGANVAYDVSHAIPYNPSITAGDKVLGAIVVGALYVVESDGGNNVIIGQRWTALPSNNYVVVVGYSAGSNATGQNLTAVGHSAGKDSTGNRLTAIGSTAGADSTGQYVAALGYYAALGNDGDYVVALGDSAGINNQHDHCVIIGYQSVATAANQIVFGSANGEFTDLFGGGGVSQATPPDFRVNATGGSGTDIAGGALKIAGGKGTGTGTGGSVVIQTAPAGSTGNSQNALVDRITVAADGSIDFHGNAVSNWGGVQSKSITVESPGAAEDLSLFFADDAITVTKIVAVLVGSSTPSVTWTIRHGTDRSATGAEVVTGGTTTTSVSGGSVVTSFNDATIVADSFVWLETTAQSGTVGQINITIFYRQDAP